MKETGPLIYCVDDEEGIRETLSYALEKEGYRTRVFRDGAEAWKCIEEKPPDLSIIDVIMPRVDGLELCRRIRGLSATLPVVFLTSKDEEIDRILGLELGADDYLTKPFSMRELLARIRVIFRRIEAYGKNDERDCVDAGPLNMNAHRFTLTWKDTPVVLTVTEFRMLAALAAESGVVKSRDQLLEAAYPEDLYVSDRSVDSHIKRIRRKIQAVDPGFCCIETIYGLGYRYAEAAGADEV